MLLKYIDAHAHLIWPDILSKLDEVMKRSQNAGVSKVINTGIELNDFSRCIDIRHRWPNIYNIIGIHPETSSHKPDSVEEFKQELQKHRQDFCAIGEIGLDFFEIKDPLLRKRQEPAFRYQLALAVDWQMPVVIHCRYAEKQALQILEESQYRDVPGVLLHCFGGGEIYIQRGLSHDNWAFTVPTSVVYKRLHQTLANLVPVERMLLETDSPFLKPFPELPMNEPQYIIDAAHKIAEIKQRTLEEIAQITTKNAEQFFSI